LPVAAVEEDVDRGGRVRLEKCRAVRLPAAHTRRRT
jgi:hypothetical protein